MKVCVGNRQIALCPFLCTLKLRIVEDIDKNVHKYVDCADVHAYVYPPILRDKIGLKT